MEDHPKYNVHTYQCVQYSTLIIYCSRNLKHSSEEADRTDNLIYTP